MLLKYWLLVQVIALVAAKRVHIRKEINIIIDKEILNDDSKSDENEVLGANQANALCTASAKNWALADWEPEIDPASDTLDRYMTTATGCTYTTTTQTGSVDHTYMLDSFGGRFEGALDIWLAVRARGPFYILLDWQYREYYIRFENNTAHLSVFGARQWKTPVEARGANDGQWYTPVHIAVMPKNVTVTLGCSDQHQLVVPRRTQHGDRFAVEVWSYNYSAKVLRNCDPNFSRSDS